MIYSSLSNHELHLLLSRKAAEERKITAEVIALLEEIQQRKYFLDLGYASLFEYCTRELKYSESSAYRRISAMRLSQDMPEVKARIEAGTLTLSNAATLQTFFKAEQRENQKHYSAEEKRELLCAIESKSKDETLRTLASLSPVLQGPQERERVLSEANTEIRFVADRVLLDKLRKLKGLLSHKDPELNYQKLFHELADLALKKLDPCVQTPSTRSNTATKPMPKNPCISQSRYVPAATKRDIWKHDQGQCSFVSPVTGKRCNSYHQIEVDHILPFALGGKTVRENLRLLCRAHNQERAARIF